MKSPYFVTLALLLAACGSNEPAPPPMDDTPDAGVVSPEAPPPMGNAAAPTDAAGYIGKAGASDLWEIESSRALLAKSANADVKNFAQMMIDHHSQSTAKVKAAAAQAKLEAPAPMLEPDQQKMLDEIKAADAAGIDAIYLAHQKTAHDAALALHQSYATNGDTPDLKKAASEIVPVVEGHRTKLAELSTQG